MGAPDRSDGADQHQTLKKRWPLYAGVLIAALAGGHFFGELPSERVVEVHVTDPTIDSIELEWSDSDDVIHRTKLARPFTDLSSRVQLRNGSYDVRVDLRRATGSTVSSRRVDVIDGANAIELTIP